MTKSFGVDINPPVGTIALWGDPLADIPAGWVLCDGNNGTPNLLNKSPKSIPDTTTDPGTTGGQNSYSLATGQLPSHGHSSGSTASSGKHNHVYKVYVGSYSGNENYSYPWLKDVTFTKSLSAGSHSHSVSVNNVGSGSSIDNRPNSRQLAFIQKT